MPPADLDRSKIDFQKYYFYGTILNVPPILLMYPMRTVRLLQQRKSSVPVSSSIFTVIRDVQQKNGTRALFAGATVFSLGLTTTKILQFATYDYMAQKTKENDYFQIEVLKSPSVLSGVLGTISAVVTTFFVVPFDMVNKKQGNARAGKMKEGRYVTIMTLCVHSIAQKRNEAGSRGLCFRVFLIIPFVFFLGVVKIHLS